MGAVVHPRRVAVFDDYLTSAGVRQAVRELQAEGILRRDGVVVGKMAAFGPPELLAQRPRRPAAARSCASATTAASA